MVLLMVHLIYFDNLENNIINVQFYINKIILMAAFIEVK